MLRLFMCYYQQHRYQRHKHSSGKFHSTKSIRIFLSMDVNRTSKLSFKRSYICRLVIASGSVSSFIYWFLFYRRTMIKRCIYLFGSGVLLPCMVFVQMCLCSLESLPAIEPSFFTQSLLELHRQLCPAEKYPHLMILQLSNQDLAQAVLPQIISEPTYTKTVSMFPVYLSIATFVHNCILYIVDSIEDFDVRT